MSGQVINFATRKMDIVAMLLYPAIAVVLSFVLDVTFLWSVFLFLGVPAIHLAVRNSHVVRRVLVFTSVVSLTFAAIIDYLAQLTRAWSIPTVFPVRLYDTASIEGFLWSVPWIFSIIAFYEYFSNHGSGKSVWRPAMKIFIGLIVGAYVVFLILFFTNKQLLEIPYAYLWIGLTTLVLPLLVGGIRRPKLLLKFLPTTIYFFYLSSLYEWTGLSRGWWNFDGGQFIGWITLWGVRLPIEEFVFWFIVAAPALLMYYEFFDDDSK